jgi:hypothetical protein
MNAQMLLNQLNFQGIEVWPEGSNIRVKGQLSDDMRNMLKMLKVEVLEALSALDGKNVRGVSIEQLKYKAGPDWEWLEANPKALESFARIVATNNMLQAGIVPPDYTSTTQCQRCGEVPIFEDCPETVYGCPWCFAGGFNAKTV